VVALVVVVAQIAVKLVQREQRVKVALVVAPEHLAFLLSQQVAVAALAQ
jgi:hypothetical protein